MFASTLRICFQHEDLAAIPGDKYSVPGERGLAEYASRTWECDIGKHCWVRHKSNDGIWK